MRPTRVFDSATATALMLGTGRVSPYLAGASAVSVACRTTCVNVFNPNPGIAYNRLITVDIAEASIGILMSFESLTGVRVRISARSQPSDALQTVIGTTGVFTISQTHGGIIDFAAGRIDVYHEGGLDGTGAVTFGASTYTPGTPTSQQDCLGGYPYQADPPASARANSLHGTLCDVCIWPGDIGAQGMMLYHQNITPYHIRPDLNPFYFPLNAGGDPEIDVFHGISTTVFGPVGVTEESLFALASIPSGRSMVALSHSPHPAIFPVDILGDETVITDDVATRMSVLLVAADDGATTSEMQDARVQWAYEDALTRRSMASVGLSYLRGGVIPGGS